MLYQLLLPVELNEISTIFGPTNTYIVSGPEANALLVSIQARPSTHTSKVSIKKVGQFSFSFCKILTSPYNYMTFKTL